MSTIQLRVVGIGLSFVLIFLSGLWLSHLGKPYNTGVFTIHKLVGLAAGALLVTVVYQIHKTTPLGPVEISAILATVLLFIGTVAAGALLSIDMEVPAFITKLHQLLPVLSLLFAAGTLYLLLRTNWLVSRL